MLSVESVFYVLVYIYLVDHLVGIVLKSSSKDDNLIVLCHGLNKLNTARSDQKVTISSILKGLNFRNIPLRYELKFHLDLVLRCKFQA